MTILTAKGIEPGEKKISAIVAMKTSTDVNELQTF